ncbi:uncharacterized protein LOC101859506 isoform X1 [Aplysia californica]|uniref:Uncharacterized protein LOC101859506 isoform X1 n=1 Tax=Aplysia californica TaxID=6500 RepID=A0ABM0K1H1_APLCA|nr:uncharacterized protein LOC101859506 isoform X1 [Aplysia californica]
MDRFFQWLQEAEAHGVSHNTFCSIWEKEQQLLQQKEESRQLELKLGQKNNSGNKQQASESNVCLPLEQMMNAHFEEQKSQMRGIRRQFQSYEKEFVGVKEQLTKITSKLLSVEGVLQKMQAQRPAEMKRLKKVASTLARLEDHVLQREAGDVFTENSISAKMHPKKQSVDDSVMNVQDKQTEDVGFKLKNVSSTLGKLRLKDRLDQQGEAGFYMKENPDLAKVNSKEQSVDDSVLNVQDKQPEDVGSSPKIKFSELLESLGSIENSTSSSPAPVNDLHPTGASINILPKNGAEISIENVTEFASARREYLSDYFYSHGKPCKVRMRVWFKRQGRLGVSLLVAPGELDDRFEWPLMFSGSGSVFHKGSGQFTSLWEFEDKACDREVNCVEIVMKKAETAVKGAETKGQRAETKVKGAETKVEAAETEIGVTIRLSSNRHPVDDVALEILEEKGYAEGDVLTLCWTVRADRLDPGMVVLH